MKIEEEEVKVYFERNLIFTIAVLIAAVLLAVLSIYLALQTSPLVLALAPLAIIANIQAIWLVVNPFVIVYENRFMIKKNILSNKEYYFLDFKSVIDEQTMQIILIYNDDDVIKFSLNGIKLKHLQPFKVKLTQSINESLQKRNS